MGTYESRRVRRQNMIRTLQESINWEAFTFEIDSFAPTPINLSEIPANIVSQPDFLEMTWRRMKTSVKIGLSTLNVNIRLTIEDSLNIQTLREHIASVFLALRCPCKIHLSFGYFLQSLTTGETTFFYASTNVANSEIVYIDSTEQLTEFLAAIDLNDIAERCLQNSADIASDRIFLRLSNMHLKVYPFLSTPLYG